MLSRTYSGTAANAPTQMACMAPRRARAQWGKLYGNLYMPRKCDESTCSLGQIFDSQDWEIGLQREESWLL